MWELPEGTVAELRPQNKRPAHARAASHTRRRRPPTSWKQAISRAWTWAGPLMVLLVVPIPFLWFAPPGECVYADTTRSRVGLPFQPTPPPPEPTSTFPQMSPLTRAWLRRRLAAQLRA